MYLAQLETGEFARGTISPPVKLAQSAIPQGYFGSPVLIFSILISLLFRVSNLNILYCAPALLLLFFLYI